MASRLPVVRPISWWATIPQFMAGGLAMVVGYALAGREGIVYGIGVYLLYSVGSRRFVPRDHRRALQLMRQEKFAEAIPALEASLEFFRRHAWIDEYRSIVLMSPSAMSYREMSLNNLAFCHAQLGDGKQARAWYERCLAEFPGSGLARAALRMLEAGK